MSEKWFKLTPSWSANRISEVTVETSTAGTVVIGGRRCTKITGFDCYFQTWYDAKAYAIGQAERELLAAKLDQDRAQSALDVARKITWTPS